MGARSPDQSHHGEIDFESLMERAIESYQNDRDENQERQEFIQDPVSYLQTRERTTLKSLVFARKPVKIPFDKETLLSMPNGELLQSGWPNIMFLTSDGETVPALLMKNSRYITFFKSSTYDFRHSSISPYIHGYFFTHDGYLRLEGTHCVFPLPSWQLLKYPQVSIAHKHLESTRMKVIVTLDQRYFGIEAHYNDGKERDEMIICPDFISTTDWNISMKAKTTIREFILDITNPTQSE